MGMSWLFGKGNAPRAPVLVALLVLLNALALRVVDPPSLVRLRDFAFDAYQRFKPREVQDDLRTLLQGVAMREVDASDASWSTGLELAWDSVANVQIPVPAQTVDAFTVSATTAFAAFGSERLPWTATALPPLEVIFATTSSAPFLLDE